MCFSDFSRPLQGTILLSQASIDNCVVEEVLVELSGILFDVVHSSYKGGQRGQLPHVYNNISGEKTVLLVSSLSILWTAVSVVWSLLVDILKTSQTFTTRYPADEYHSLLSQNPMCILSHYIKYSSSYHQPFLSPTLSESLSRCAVWCSVVEPVQNCKKGLGEWVEFINGQRLL